MPLFLYGLKVKGSAYQEAYHFGYTSHTSKIILISDVIKNRDSDFFNTENLKWHWSSII